VKQLIHQLQADNTTLHAPTLMRYEVIAVSRKAVYQGRVTPEEGMRARDRLLSYPIALHFDDDLVRRGYELATEYNNVVVCVPAYIYAHNAKWAGLRDYIIALARPSR
jgi:predicted nucleic acid-binding protein